VVDLAGNFLLPVYKSWGNQRLRGKRKREGRKGQRYLTIWLGEGVACRGDVGEASVGEGVAVRPAAAW
jgi:hypothetical protein